MTFPGDIWINTCSWQIDTDYWPKKHFHPTPSFLVLLWLHWNCLQKCGWAFGCCNKYYNQKQRGDERVYVGLTVTGPSLSKARGGTQGRNWSRDNGGMYLGTFFIESRPICQRRAPLTVTGPSCISWQLRKCSETCSQADLIEAINQLKFPRPKWFWPKLSSTKDYL